MNSSITLALRYASKLADLRSASLVIKFHQDLSPPTTGGTGPVEALLVDGHAEVLYLGPALAQHVLRLVVQLLVGSAGAYRRQDVLRAQLHLQGGRGLFQPSG